MTLSEKMAYIKGMADSIDLDQNDKKDKLIMAMVDVLSDLAGEIDDLGEYVDDVAAQVDEIDEDLGNVEEDFYGDECDCGCCDDDDCDCCDDGGAVCPKCGAEFELDLDALENGDIITCPECGAELNFEYVDDEDETEE